MARLADLQVRSEADQCKRRCHAGKVGHRRQEPRKVPGDRKDRLSVRPDRQEETDHNNDQRGQDSPDQRVLRHALHDASHSGLVPGIRVNAHGQHADRIVIQDRGQLEDRDQRGPFVSCERLRHHHADDRVVRPEGGLDQDAFAASLFCQKRGCHPSDHCQQRNDPQHQRDHRDRQSFLQIYAVDVHEHQAEVAVPEIEAVDLGDRLLAQHPCPFGVISENDQKQDREDRVHGILQDLQHVL